MQDDCFLKGHGYKPLLQAAMLPVQNELGKGAFQELDQVKAVQQFCKYAGSASSPKDIVPTLTAALKVSTPLQLVHASCCTCQLAASPPRLAAL